jgi:predicted Zn-dependent protease
LSRQGKAPESLKLCKALRSRLPPATYAQAVLEVLFATNEDLPKAQVQAFSDWLNQQIKGNPKQYGLRLAAAGVESRLGRHGDAIRLLTALKAEAPPDDPVYPGVVNNLAFLTAFAEERPDQAERLLAAQLATAPSQLELRDTLGVVYLEQNKVDEALAEFRELSLLMPKGVVLFHLARAQSLKGDKAGARVSLEKAVKLKFRPEELHSLERKHYERLRASLQS